MILAIAILGLSASIIADKACNPEGGLCISAERILSWENLGLKTIRYCIFLGTYGILIASVGTASLFVDKIPMIVPLVGDSIGALFYLSGGIAWIASLNNVSCRKRIWRYVSEWYTDFATSACKRCEADHGLAWALFAFTASLAICDFLRRRDQVQSFR